MRRKFHRLIVPLLAMNLLLSGCIFAATHVVKAVIKRQHAAHPAPPNPRAYPDPVEAGADATPAGT